MPIPYTWIYLIHDPFTGYYKIGKSDNPDARIRQLCSPSNYGTKPAAPTDYILLEAWLAPETSERELHSHYEESRINGEWFDFQILYEGSPFSAKDTAFVKHDIEGQHFRSHTRWIGESSLLEDEYCELLESNERLYKELHLHKTPLLVQGGMY